MLLKAPDGLERLAEVDTIVFDKTGTLTHGHPTLLNAEDIDADILKRAAGLALASRHPYALAVVAAAKKRFGADAIPRAEDVTEAHGFGLQLGEERLGSAEWCDVPEFDAQKASLWYTRPGSEPFSFQFADVLREDAAETIGKLRAVGYTIELLSGDRIEAVQPVAQTLGVDRWQARCKPQDKIAHLEELKAGGAKVLMVGDGLNDAPALAAANASLSPSTAADISQIASDVVFQGSKLNPLIDLLATARQSQRMAFGNFAIAGVYNTTFIPIAAFGGVTPFLAAIAMSSSSIIVTANALRLRGMKLTLSELPKKLEDAGRGFENKIGSVS
jgi:Cu2+-exporting ATPase